MEPNETSAGMPSEQNDATMQNDSNMTAETPSVDVAVGAEAIVASEEIAESGKTLKDDTVGGMMAGGAEPKKNGKGMLIGMILFALLAAGGIGFGVWAMMDGNSQTKTLNDQIGDLKKTNSELMEKLSRQEEKPVVDNEVIIDADTSTKVNSEDYIYVGEWGIKIKKPENWGDSVVFNGYEYDHNTQTYDTLLIELYIVGKAERGILQINYPISASCSDIYANCMEYNGDFYSIETYTLKDGHTYQENDIPESLVKYFLTPENYSAI